ncbi:hypothetical protein PG984_000181 [Apiospora sp. TS-2023a]
MSDQATSHAGDKAAVDALDRFCVCLDKCTCLAVWPVSFEKRVPLLRELCRTLWPHAMHDKTVFEPELDHDLNLHYPVRITYEGKEEEPKRVVIQIPYYDEKVEKYAQNLQYLDKFPEIRDLVPKVLQFDTTRDNPLRRPYLVRSWIPGKPLTEVYNNMTQEQKVMVAAELGRTWYRLEGVCGLYSGDPVPAKDDEHVEEDDEFAPQFKSMMRIRPFGLVEDRFEDKLDWDQIRDSIAEGDDKHKDQVLHRFNLLEDEPASTARKILLLTFERRIQRNRHWAIRKYENYDLEPALEIVRDIVNKECNAASFPRAEFEIGLHNPDLLGVPENIMVDFDGEGKPVVTGLADWDLTEWAPRFLRCQPPTWLWTPGAVHDNSENPKPEMEDWPKDEEGHYKPKTEPLDLVMPVDDAGRAVKRAFDDAAGEGFRTGAYNPDIVFARRYFAVAARQEWQICDVKELAYLAREWAERKARCTCGRA